MESLEWSCLDESHWNVLSCLGKNWACKWFASENGYAIIATDSSGLWGELRSSVYMEENAQEWASCLQAEVKELGDLVLKDLVQDRHPITTSVTKEAITLTLNARLGKLPYKWIFEWSTLPQSLMERHFTEPLLVQLELLSTKLMKLEDELKKKQAVIDEFQPINVKANKKANAAKVDNTVDLAADRMLNTGIGLMLTQHLINSPSILSAVTEKRSSALKNAYSNFSPKKAPIMSRVHKRIQKGAVSDDEDDDTNTSPSNDSSLEEARRAKIQAVIQGADKKPKLSYKNKNIRPKTVKDEIHCMISILNNKLPSIY